METQEYKILIWFSNPLLIDVVNKLKVNKKKFHATISQGNKFQSRIKLLKYSKYLFNWSGRFQFPTKARG